MLLDWLKWILGAAGLTYLIDLLLGQKPENERGAEAIILPTPREIARPSDFDTIVYKFDGLLSGLWQIAEGKEANPVRRRQILRQWQATLEPVESWVYEGKSDTRSLTAYGAWQQNLRSLGCREFEEAIESEHSTQRLAKTWLNLLLSWGIVSGNTEGELRMDEDTERTYSVYEQYQLGDLVRIVRPCWWYDGTVIEKGLLEALPSQTDNRNA